MKKMLNQILKIENKSINNEVVNTINARTLWEFLESKRNFADWIRDRLQDFVENEDFVLVSQNYEIKGKGGDRRSKDYFLKIDTAKHLAMLERNEKGKQARNYFIQIEKEYKNNYKQKNCLYEAKINQINLNDFDNWQYYYLNDPVLSFPYFRYKIEKNTKLPLINLEDYRELNTLHNHIKKDIMALYMFYGIDRNNPQDFLYFSDFYELIQKNEILKGYVEEFRTKYKEALNQELLQQLNNPLQLEDYEQTPAVADYMNLIGNEKLLTATEIGAILGISGCMVGKIANRLNMKIEKFGAWFRDKAAHSIKEVQTFKYNNQALNEFKKFLGIKNIKMIEV